MTTRLHVLVQAAPGGTPAMQRAVTAIPGVVSVAMTAGPYDAILEVSLDDSVPLGPTLSALRAADGVELLRTCEPCHPTVDQVVTLPDTGYAVAPMRSASVTESLVGASQTKP